ncbi:hypothetical protein HK099_003334 [Clydaea vesicula]|uniref:Tryptophan synthase beta chain-like PALP domain-containing protein n=1 Tax=Clydaea vesicula TaxID=447962 RepID=A0AAD5UAD2_9FUNG|nr:hypothetical protein HK099_003334 [Clydaea vesicula]
MDIAMIILILLLSLILVIFLILVLASTIFSGIYYSINPSTQLLQPMEETEMERNPLFRKFPILKNKIAWKELGVYPTPIHQATINKESYEGIKFWIKREDLSSPIYGGNKVRTLQYQIAACEVHHFKNPHAKFFTVGSSGSNQLVATLVHGKYANNLPISIIHAGPDEPELDNTLNVLSTISFKPSTLLHFDPSEGSRVKVILKTLFYSDNVDKIFNMGGNNITGVLGQIGAAIELGEQIERGEVPDVDAIYLAVGSSCTVTGIILGICFCKALGMNAFNSPRLKVVGILIHHSFAKLHQVTGFYKSEFSRFVHLTPRYGISAVAKYLRNLGCIDIEQEALKKERFEAFSDAEVIGMYGAHSERSLITSSLDAKIELKGELPQWLKGNDSIPIPWLCGHFVGKAFTVMMDRLKSNQQDGENVLLWQTKSHIQPRGSYEGELEELKKYSESSKKFREYVEKGKETSILRPGKVDLKADNGNDYRHLMKKLP